jgi:hypothetical protein
MRTQVLAEGSLVARINVLEALVFPVVCLTKSCPLDLPFKPFCLICNQTSHMPTDLTTTTTTTTKHRRRRRSSSQSLLSRLPSSPSATTTGERDSDRCCGHLCDSCAATFEQCPLIHTPSAPKASSDTVLGLPRTTRLSTSDIIQATTYAFASS